MNSAKVQKPWFKVIWIDLTGGRKIWSNISCNPSNYHYNFILNFLNQKTNQNNIIKKKKQEITKNQEKKQIIKTDTIEIQKLEYSDSEFEKSEYFKSFNDK